MVNQQNGDYYIEVLSGDSAGKIYSIGNENILVGSLDVNEVVLSDPGVMAEHFTISHSNKRIMVENLSSRGIYVDGKFVNNKIFLKAGNTITIGDGVNIKLCSVNDRNGVKLANIIFPLIILLIVISGAGYMVKSLHHKKDVSNTEITQHQWNLAYSRIYKRLKVWEENRQINETVNDRFADAWIRDNSGDNSYALAKWAELYTLMTIMPVVGVTDGKPVVECVDDNPLMLYAMMNRVRVLDPSESLSVAESDKAYLNALWWFVNLRIEHIRDEMNQE